MKIEKLNVILEELMRHQSEIGKVTSHLFNFIEAHNTGQEEESFDLESEDKFYQELRENFKEPTEEFTLEELVLIKLVMDRAGKIPIRKAIFTGDYLSAMSKLPLMIYNLKTRKE